MKKPVRLISKNPYLLFHRPENAIYHNTSAK